MSARQVSDVFVATARCPFRGVPSKRTDARFRLCSQSSSSRTRSVATDNLSSRGHFWLPSSKISAFLLLHRSFAASSLSSIPISEHKKRGDCITSAPLLSLPVSQ